MDQRVLEDTYVQTLRLSPDYVTDHQPYAGIDGGGAW
jgi:hypothetical protein